MTVQEIIAKVTSGELTADQAAVLIAAQNQPAQQALRFKVSDKGAVSVYGLQVRFPVTLYLGQWERLIAAMPELKQFIADNRAKLAVKGVAMPAEKTKVQTAADAAKAKLLGKSAA